MYPTLACMALDILPIAAASVGAESLFSRAKEVSTDRRSWLDPDMFEQIECLKYHWMRSTPDHVRANHEEAEDLYINTFTSMETEAALLPSDTEDEELDL